MSDLTTLTLLVSEASQDAADAKAEDFEEQALPHLHWGRPKDVDLDKLKDNLARVQGQVDGLLASVAASKASGFRLTSVEVGLAISAEGSIGVATAGLEASLSLSFERVAPK